MTLKARALALSLTALTISLTAAAPPASAENRRGAPAREGARYSRAVVSYDAPDVTLLDMDGTSTSLHELLSGDEPVVLQFIFTTCNTACPMLSSMLARSQSKLAKGPDPARLLSISIDPEHDTPARLREYAAKFNAGPHWRFLTGDPDDIVSVQKAFGVYHENKLRHPPTTLVRSAADQPWLRLDGFIKPPQLAAEMESLRTGGESPSR